MFFYFCMLLQRFVFTLQFCSFCWCRYNNIFASAAGYFFNYTTVLIIILARYSMFLIYQDNVLIQEIMPTYD